VDRVLKWLARVGERVGDVEPGDMLPISREDGRCCHDKVPARLRDIGGRARDGESIPRSGTDPRRFSVVSAASMSWLGSTALGIRVSGPGVCGVGSSCSGGSIDPGLIEETLSRAILRVDESSVRASDRARSGLSHSDVSTLSAQQMLNKSLHH
jgi:hypothetical protein